MIPFKTDISLDETILSYWNKRVWNVLKDTYCGIGLMKFPEDLRVYEHLIWESKPNVIIEIGCHSGGSTLWFKDRLFSMRQYVFQKTEFRIVAIDLDVSMAEANISKLYPNYSENITFIKGDVLDNGLPEKVMAVVPPAAKFLIIEDSAHNYETTLSALNNFSPLLGIGEFFIIEDTCVDEERMRPTEEWPRGAGRALKDWLKKNHGFKQRIDLEMYGLSCHPGGFIERIF